ncbi:MAG TPA: hypothetical protein VF941_18770 [Clostridia bacterium]
MYNQKNYNLDKNDIAIELSAKQGMDTSIHWLNPLLMKCRNK